MCRNIQSLYRRSTKCLTRNPPPPEPKFSADTPLALDEFELAKHYKALFADAIEADKKGVGLVFQNNTEHDLVYYVNNGKDERKIPKGSYAVFSPNNGGEFNVWKNGSEVPEIDSSGNVTGKLKTINTFETLTVPNSKMENFEAATQRASDNNLPMPEGLNAETAAAMIQKLKDWNPNAGVTEKNVSAAFYEVRNPVKLIRVPTYFPGGVILKRSWGNAPQAMEPGAVLQMSGGLEEGYVNIYVNGGANPEKKTLNKGTLDQFFTASGDSALDLLERNELPFIEERQIFESCHTQEVAAQWFKNAKASAHKTQEALRGDMVGDADTISATRSHFQDMSRAEASMRRNQPTQQR